MAHRGTDGWSASTMGPRGGDGISCASCMQKVRECQADDGDGTKRGVLPGTMPRGARRKYRHGKHGRPSGGHYDSISRICSFTWNGKGRRHSGRILLSIGVTASQAWLREQQLGSSPGFHNFLFFFFFSLLLTPGIFPLPITRLLQDCAQEQLGSRISAGTCIGFRRQHRRNKRGS